MSMNEELLVEQFYKDGLTLYRTNNSLESKHPFNQFIKTYVESRVILQSTNTLCDAIKEAGFHIG